MRHLQVVLPTFLLACPASGGDVVGMASVPTLGSTEDLPIDAETADLVHLNAMLVRADGAFLLEQASEGMIKALLPDGTTAWRGR